MTEIVAPFAQFFDTSGAPLANGAIYIGIANLDAESNPIEVYWDEALTIPAPQPIRTLNGYPVWNGAPARLYANVASYSITVRNAQGRVMYSVQNALSIPLISDANGSSLVGFIQDGPSAVARTAEEKMREIVSVKDFGAVGDGVTNDRAAIATAVSAARGKTLLFPAGQYVIDTSGGSIPLEEVSLLAEGVLDGATAAIDRGSVFRIIGAANSPFLIRRGVSIDGFGFFYPTQINSATPSVFAPTLDFEFSNGAVQFVFIENCVVYNAWRWLRINDAVGNVGHVFIENNTVCGINRCIEITNHLETIKIKGNTFTFGHWLEATEAGTRGYIRSNGVVLEYRGGDGLIFADGNLLYGYLAGVRCSSGNMVLPSLSDNKFDNVRLPFIVNGTGRVTQGKFESNVVLAFNSQDTTQQGIGLFLNGSGGSFSLNITDNQFLTCTESHIAIDTTELGKVVIDGNTFEGAGHLKAAGSFSSVSLNCANFDVQIGDNYIQGQGNAFVNGVTAFSVRDLNMVGAKFINCNAPLSIASAANVFAVGCQSSGTVSATSDSIASVTGRIYQSGNWWDKPSGNVGKPQVLARKNASQTFNSGTATDVTFQTEVYDRSGDFASPTFTAPAALGRQRYRFTMALLHDNTATAGDRWQILLATTSGNMAWSYRVPAAEFNSLHYTATIELMGGATARWQIQRAGGAGSLVTVNDSNANFMSVEMVE